MVTDSRGINMHQRTSPPGRWLQSTPPHVPHWASQQKNLSCTPGTPLLQTASGASVGLSRVQGDRNNSGGDVMQDHIAQNRNWCETTRNTGFDACYGRGGPRLFSGATHLKSDKTYPNTESKYARSTRSNLSSTNHTHRLAYIVYMESQRD